jgi:hypothetical protein
VAHAGSAAKLSTKNAAYYVLTTAPNRSAVRNVPVVIDLLISVVNIPFVSRIGTCRQKHVGESPSEILQDMTREVEPENF